MFGITLLFPSLWEKIPFVSKISIGSNKTLGRGHLKKTFWGDVLVGASLGPIFSTCSPTYFVILATVLPASFLLGSLYLFSYTFGLSLMLLLIALLGEKLTSRLNGLSDSRGIFKRVIGLLFILLGIAIVLGLEKKFETELIEHNYFDVTKIETRLLQKIEQQKPGVLPESTESLEVSKIVPPFVTAQATNTLALKNPPKQSTPVTKKVDTSSVIVAPITTKNHIEIINPSGFINSGDAPIAVDEYIGKKVILLNVMTYSCSNCQATFPYTNTWYETYKNQGLIVIGIHTPEFAFEKDKQNVIDAMKKFGITYPVVMDNDYATWNALGNRFWPHKYLVDIHGVMVYEHIGEGAYEETEAKIQSLLAERREVLGL